MRVVRHGKEDLEIELSGVNYYFWGGFGRGETWDSSVFLVVDICKVVEEYSPDVPDTPRLADIDEQEKQWVRETVCAEWGKDGSKYTSRCDISFYDKNGNFLCTNDNRINVLTISDFRLEVHMDGTIVQFSGEKRNGTFVALASSMMWLRPNERKATAEELDTCVKKLEQYYKIIPRENRSRIVWR